jgi:hypothetical protein
MLRGFGRRVGTVVKQRYMLSVMCGRSTYKVSWEGIVALYRLTLDQPARNKQARYLPDHHHRRLLLTRMRHPRWKSVRQPAGLFQLLRFSI